MYGKVSKKEEQKNLQRFFNIFRLERAHIVINKHDIGAQKERMKIKKRTTIASSCAYRNRFKIRFSFSCSFSYSFLCYTRHDSCFVSLSLSHLHLHTDTGLVLVPGLTTHPLQAIAGLIRANLNAGTLSSAHCFLHLRERERGS